MVCVAPHHNIIMFLDNSVSQNVWQYVKFSCRLLRRLPRYCHHIMSLIIPWSYTQLQVGASWWYVDNWNHSGSIGAALTQLHMNGLMSCLSIYSYILCVVCRRRAIYLRYLKCGISEHTAVCMTCGTVEDIHHCSSGVMGSSHRRSLVFIVCCDCGVHSSSCIISDDRKSYHMTQRQGASQITTIYILGANV